MREARCRQLQQIQKEQDAQLQNLKVFVTDDKGRVMVALNDFAPGDVVLLESPTSKTWSSDAPTVGDSSCF